MGRGFRCVLLAIAATALIAAAPSPAAAAPGDTFNEAKPLTVGDSNFGPIQPSGTVWHVYSSGPAPPASVTLSGCNLGAFDSEIIVSQGPSHAVQTTIPGGDAQNGCGTSDRARLKFAPLANQTYYVRVVSHDAVNLNTYNLAFNATPANDDLLGAQTLGTAPVNVTSSSVGATKEPLEPDHANIPGDTSLWYQWSSPPGGGVTTINACSSSPAQVALGVYTGNALPTLVPVAALPTSNQCRVVFIAPVLTTTYRIAVAGINAGNVNPGGVEGTVNLSVALPPSNDNIANAAPLAAGLIPPIDVLGDNAGATLESGETHGGYEFSIWYSWTPSSSGQVALDTCDPANASLTRVDLYTSAPPAAPLADNEGGCADGNHGKLITTVAAGTPYLISVSSAGFGGATRLKIDTDTTPPSGGGGGGGGSGGGGGGTATPPSTTTPAKKKCKKKKKHASAAKKCKKKKKH
ncbi:MAG: hypothetical protein QOD60_2439 [Solirubrobacterales bacterium]|jgi:hypothetical protein|nr:hypothetical protein [Solirubrobacterales bacterium]